MAYFGRIILLPVCDPSCDSPTPAPPTHTSTLRRLHHEGDDWSPQPKMPHKHTRRDKDDSTYDLPPTQIARPLPVVAPGLTRQTHGKGGKKNNHGHGGNNNNKNKGAAAQQNAQQDLGVSKKRKRGADTKDDAPRAFKRLMALKDGRKVRDGLDDGSRPANNKKKRKAAAAGAEEDEVKAASEAAAIVAAAKKKNIPTIQPGERMSEFAARVDAALPVMGLVKKSTKGKDPLGLKVHRTLKEKKMHKLYDEWRREEAAIQEQRREELEDAEEREMEEEGAAGGSVKWRVDMESEAATGGKKGKKKGGKRGKGAKSVWEVDDGDDADPWEALKKKRGEAKIGLHDVVKAPPVFKTIPKQVFKVGGATVDVGTIPKSAGSLKRREELQTVREEVIASYRKMMEGKRARVESQDE
ncbi:hypothetical protein BD289DRAFT_471003 [Coniella lustricola]|uniref:Urease accessory protein UreD n=1 Tax=Coniella lustricola TaxID=2025994 RepID=A0A2T3AL33_9PEZI|nr:hypothetical protein BD289DRAFT_471003 [Coniella lustricola]